MNITGFGYGNNITLDSAGGASLVAQGTGPNLKTKGLVAGTGVTLTAGAGSLTVDIASGGAFLPLNGSGTMGGDIKMGGNSLTAVASVSGPTNSRTADNIVSNTGAGIAGRVAIFVSDKVIQDGGVLLSNLATTAALGSYLLRSGGIMTGPVNMNGNQLQNVNYIGGSSNITFADYILSQPSAWTVGNLPYYNSAINRTLQDSGIAVTNIVQSPATSVLNRIAVFADTTGKVLADGGSLLAQYALLAGAAFSGAISGTTAAFSGLVTCARITASSATVFSGYTSGGFAVPFTAGVAKLVSIATLTELTDPTNEFTPLGSGAVQYTGATTRLFNVNILFNVGAGSTTQTYSAWVSKTSSLTLVAARAFNFSTTTSGYLPFQVSNVYQLATNDTVQLAAQYSATGNVNVFDIQVQIVPVT